MRTIKILLLSKNGQVGSLGAAALGRSAGRVRALRLDLDSRAPFKVDSTQPESLAPRMPSVRPDVTVNAAALRALQMQADCVFDCSGSTPRDELSFTGPKSVYGRTNLEAMHRVVRPRYLLILRAKCVNAARRGNFARTMCCAGC